MKILCKKNNGAFYPAYDSDYQKACKVKEGEMIEIEFKRPRNYKFHKKFFSLLNLGFNSSKSKIENFDDYREWALMRSGFVREVKTPRGVFHRATSISFANMDDDEFQEVYKAVLQFVILDTGATENDIEENLINYM